MIPGINPRDMQNAMKRLGIKQEEIDAQEVIIKTPDSEIVIHNPQVSKVNMMGQESLQIVGDIEEVEKQTQPEISSDDIETVIDQTSCTKEEAVQAIEEANGNLAEAIIKLQSR